MATIIDKAPIKKKAPAGVISPDQTSRFQNPKNNTNESDIPLRNFLDREIDRDFDNPDITRNKRPKTLEAINRKTICEQKIPTNAQLFWSTPIKPIMTIAGMAPSWVANAIIKGVIKSKNRIPCKFPKSIFKTA